MGTVCLAQPGFPPPVRETLMELEGKQLTPGRRDSHQEGDCAPTMSLDDLLCTRHCIPQPDCWSYSEGEGALRGKSLRGNVSTGKGPGGL